ncbi:hypothetical protein [Alicyclobacillus sp. SO9]|uniref:hypothetical protein n=1 Tax=Alicyclobacillus sp. SO9 TaxID=2665646 RepID=UPI0018E739C7|nr:hypothetical protein [Alicyclobacillus sp. SO9]QQE77145.1 hypothetical protein GI364_14315 [Alicyclobacillus sp. SO9]
MKDSRRVPGHAMRPMDVAGTERQRKRNLKQYEVHSDDLSHGKHSRRNEGQDTRE